MSECRSGPARSSRTHAEASRCSARCRRPRSEHVRMHPAAHDLDHPSACRQRQNPGTRRTARPFRGRLGERSRSRKRATVSPPRNCRAKWVSVAQRSTRLMRFVHGEPFHLRDGRLGRVEGVVAVTMPGQITRYGGARQHRTQLYWRV
jgi:hypothetical protein